MHYEPYNHQEYKTIVFLQLLYVVILLTLNFINSIRKGR